MPKAKERKPDNKIKNHGKDSKPVQEQARRVMTAKLRKELVQQKQAARSSSGEPVRDDASAGATTETVEQVEQTVGASVQEAGQQVRHGVSKAVTKTKQRRQEMREQQDQSKGPEQTPEVPIPETPEVSILGQREPPRPNAGQAAVSPSTPQAPAPAGSTQTPKVHPSQLRTDPPVLKVKPADAEAPSPVSSTPAQPERFTPTCCGKPATHGTPVATMNPASFENQSIHQSIKERPRPSTILKEKSQSWTIAPRTPPNCCAACRMIFPRNAGP